MSRENVQDFIKFSDQCLKGSYAQRLQDLWCIWETGFNLGYYVEFGALNGRDFSNTYLLEQLGWDGLVAEPHPDYKLIVPKNRNCSFSTKCVYNKTGEIITFHAVKGRPALSSIGAEMSKDDKMHFRENYTEHLVETITLVDLLQEKKAPNKIDFLSIDTEGSELAILSAFDFNAFNIQCICVEHNEVMRKQLYDLLTAKGYRRKWPEISGHDDWYIKKGAFPNWSSQNKQQTINKINTISPFENQFSERENLIKNLKSQ